MVEAVHASWTRTRIPFLMYHGIADTSLERSNFWTVSPEAFAAQLELLKSQAYTPLTVSKLVSFIYDRGDRLPEKPVVLTFDDGLANFIDEALPILDRYGFPATLYVSTAYVQPTSRGFDPSRGKNISILSWAEIQEIASHGIELGSHGHNHTELDILPIKKMQEEVRMSKDILEQKLQEQVVSFSYPYELSCLSLRKIVQQAGYSSGCAVKHAMMTPQNDRFALARIAITSNLTLAGFQELLLERGLKGFYENEPMRTKIYRFVRKLKSRLKKANPGEGRVA